MQSTKPHIQPANATISPRSQLSSEGHRDKDNGRISQLLPLKIGVRATGRRVLRVWKLDAVVKRRAGAVILLDIPYYADLHTFPCAHNASLNLHVSQQ
jgi:hypothetical protein